MKRKVVFIFLLVSIVAMTISGCGDENVSIPRNSVPFITVQSEGNKAYAMLNVWNLSTGMIDKTKRVIYRVNNANNKIIVPVFWDGESSIILPRSVSWKTKMYKEINLPKIYTSPGIHGLISKNCEIIKTSNSNTTYIVKMLDREMNSFKDVCTIKTPDYYPIGITNDNDYIYMLFCGDYNFKSGNVNLNLCTININSKKIVWKKVSIQKGIVLPVGILPEDVVAISKYFYITGCCNYFVKINVKNALCNKLEFKIPQIFSKNTSKLNYIMLGNFRDMLLIKVAQDESPSYNYDVIAFNPEKEVVVGALKVLKDSLKIIGKKGNILSETVFKDIKVIVFPKTNTGF